MDRGRGGRGASWRGTASRLGVAAAVALAVFASWPQAGRRVGYEALPVSRCDASVEAVVQPWRAGVDRALLPLGYRASATTTATVCRYAGDVPVAAVGLDPARSARLAAVLGAPAGGWPDDVLSARNAPPLTDAQLAEAAGRVAAAPCGRSTPSAVPVHVVTFDYVEGPQVVVLVRGAPCAAASNGTITVPPPPGTLEELDAVDAVPLA